MYSISKLNKLNNLLIISKKSVLHLMFSVTWYFLRELCKKGKITTLKYGNSWLINVDELYAFFQGRGEQR